MYIVDISTALQNESVFTILVLGNITRTCTIFDSVFFHNFFVSPVWFVFLCRYRYVNFYFSSFSRITRLVLAVTMFFFKSPPTLVPAPGRGPNRLQVPQHSRIAQQFARALRLGTVGWVHGHWHFVTIIQLYRFYINN